MKPSTRRAAALAQKAEAKMEAERQASIPYVHTIHSHASPQTDKEWAENAEARRLLDEAAAGRVRIGHHMRVVRTREDLEAEDFPVRPTEA